MTMRVSGSNSSASFAMRSMAEISHRLQRSLSRLSTGKRINSAADDSSGLAISNGLTAQIRGTTQGIRNLNESRGWIATADSALQSQMEILQRMRELALQSANGTLSNQDREYLNGELQQLYSEFNRITEKTNFNGVRLLAGDESSRGLFLGGDRQNQLNLSFARTRDTDVFKKEVGNAKIQSNAGQVGGPGEATPEFYDFNNDGIDDYFALGGSITRSAVVGRGTGEGGFQNLQNLFSDGSGLGSFADYAIADMNGDGNLDVLISNTPSSGDSSLLLYVGDGNMGFTSQVVATSSSSIYFDIADLNADGHLDLGVTTSTSLVSYLNNGSGSFQARSTLSLTGVTGGDFEFADLDGDGDLDFVRSNLSASNAHSALNDGNGTFTRSSTFTLGSTNNVKVLSGDFNSDGILDLIRQNPSAQNVSLFLGTGSGNFTAGTTITIGTNFHATTDLRIGDWDADGNLDFVGRTSTGSAAFRFGDGDGNFSRAQTITASSGAPTFFDLNNDNRIDARVGNFIYLQGANGEFYAQQRVTTAEVDPGLSATGLGGAGAADLNQDGILDLVFGAQDEAFQGLILTAILGSEEVSATDEINISSQEDAVELLDILDGALEELADRRSQLGAIFNRLDHASSSLGVASENLETARSQTLDADFAEETAELTKNQILQQAATAVFSQANLQLRAVLELLQS